MASEKENSTGMREQMEDPPEGKQDKVEGQTWGYGPPSQAPPNGWGYYGGPAPPPAQFDDPNKAGGSAGAGEGTGGMAPPQGGWGYGPPPPHWGYYGGPPPPEMAERQEGGEKQAFTASAPPSSFYPPPPNWHYYPPPGPGAMAGGAGGEPSGVQPEWNGPPPPAGPNGYPGYYPPGPYPYYSSHPAELPTYSAGGEDPHPHPHYHHHPHPHHHHHHHHQQSASSPTGAPTEGTSTANTAPVASSEGVITSSGSAAIQPAGFVPSAEVIYLQPIDPVTEESAQPPARPPMSTRKKWLLGIAAALLALSIPGFIIFFPVGIGLALFAGVFFLIAACVD